MNLDTRAPKSEAGPSTLETLDLEWIFETALLTRLYESRIIKLAKEGVVPPLIHPGAGQEVSQLAAISALHTDDPILYGHRGVAYMVGRGVSLTAMLADLAGREGGTNNGKGSVMHVVDIDKGIYGESGTLGGGFVIATGMGMAIKKQRRPQVVVHFFGDGTSNRGTFHESLNWAALQKLPIVFICENNGWAVSVPTAESTSVENISVRAGSYGIPGLTVDGNDPEAVYDAVAAAAARARSGEGPSLIEVKNIRLLGHYATDPQDYRADAASASERDPLAILRRRLIAQGLHSEPSLEAMEVSLSRRIEDIVDTVKASPMLDGELAFTDLYA